MKKIKVIMLTALFSIAIACAYASKVTQENLVFDSEQQVNGECVLVVSGCTPMGAHNCIIIVYLIASSGESHCVILLLKHP